MFDGIYFQYSQVFVSFLFSERSDFFLISYFYPFRHLSLSALHYLSYFRFPSILPNDLLKQGNLLALLVTQLSDPILCQSLPTKKIMRPIFPNRFLSLHIPFSLFSQQSFAQLPLDNHHHLLVSARHLLLGQFASFTYWL